MVLNIKTKTMLITTYQKLHKLLVKEIGISVNNHTLDCVTSEKLLVDPNFTLKGHVDKVFKIAKFLCIKPFLPTVVCIKYCEAFIFPHFDYCSTGWGSTQLERLYKLLKRTARLVIDLPTQ